jgi:mannose-1-phosphate guanylyltransferase
MNPTITGGKLWGIVLAAGEGTRVRDFLQHLCGGRGIKQFCAVIGRRSMLEHTLARVERLISRERQGYRWSATASARYPS